MKTTARAALSPNRARASNRREGARRAWRSGSRCYKTQQTTPIEDQRANSCYGWARNGGSGTRGRAARARPSCSLLRSRPSARRNRVQPAHRRQGAALRSLRCGRVPPDRTSFERCGPFDCVYHCAAEFGRWNGEDFYEQLWRTNAVGTKNIIRLQERLNFRLIHFSSSEVYGDWPELMVETVMDELRDQAAERLRHDQMGQ